MGAVLVTEEIGATLSAGEHGTTFGGGPLVATVANYILSRISDPGFLADVREKGECMRKALLGMAERSKRVRAVRGAGLMWGIDVVEPAAEVVRRGWAAGLLTLTAGDHTVRLLPPLVISREDLERGVALLESVIES
jgi:Ornithine/acetylornithine aminotransferase